eukprot:3304013-Pyramimonas_sp.AAC.1
MPRVVCGDRLHSLEQCRCSECSSRHPSQWHGGGTWRPSKTDASSPYSMVGRRSERRRGHQWREWPVDDPARNLLPAPRGSDGEQRLGNEPSRRQCAIAGRGGRRS